MFWYEEILPSHDVDTVCDFLCKLDIVEFFQHLHFGCRSLLGTRTFSFGWFERISRIIQNFLFNRCGETEVSRLEGHIIVVKVAVVVVCIGCVGSNSMRLRRLFVFLNLLVSCWVREYFAIIIIIRFDRLLAAWTLFSRFGWSFWRWGFLEDE